MASKPKSPKYKAIYEHLSNLDIENLWVEVMHINL